MHHAVGVATDGRGEMRILIHGLTAETRDGLKKPHRVDPFYIFHNQINTCKKN